MTTTPATTTAVNVNFGPVPQPPMASRVLPAGFHDEPPRPPRHPIHAPVLRAEAPQFFVIVHGTDEFRRIRGPFSSMQQARTNLLDTVRNEESYANNFPNRAAPGKFDILELKATVLPVVSHHTNVSLKDV